MKLNIITLVILLLAILLLLPYVFSVPWTPLRIVGVAIAAPSFALVVVARIQLGRSFSVSAKATRLVTTGLYSRIRNPIYVFSTFAFAGAILFSGKLWLLVLVVLIAALQTARSRKEARMLEEKFGSAYRAYRRNTWF